MISCPELFLSEAITDITNILNSSHHYLMPLTTPVHPILWEIVNLNLDCNRKTDTREGSESFKFVTCSHENVLKNGGMRVRNSIPNLQVLEVHFSMDKLVLAE